MGPASRERFRELLENAWLQRASLWQTLTQVNVFTEAQIILCQAICAWAAVPLTSHQAQQRAAYLTAMIDAFGGIGPRNWRGRLARRRCEHWARGLIRQTRDGELRPPAGARFGIAVSKTNSLMSRLRRSSFSTP